MASAKTTREIQQIALLRGINVGGRNKLKMAELRALLEKSGFKDVATYIQSGNVLFQNCGSNSANAQKIKKLIATEFEYDVKVLMLNASVLATVADGNPFGQDFEDHLHVTFLGAKPKAAALKSTVELQSAGGLKLGDDQFKVVQDVVYIHCPNGYGRTKLNNTFFETKLQVEATTRNWKTLNKLIELAGSTT